MHWTLDFPPHWRKGGPKDPSFVAANGRTMLDSQEVRQALALSLVLGVGVVVGGASLQLVSPIYW